jgi:lipopolysaccharide assembly outer membrane protein LptD (OstA)
MKGVKALFYLKDDTILEIWSDYGVYNNQTLDMQFNTNVEANYVDDKLFADKAEYSSSLSTLTVADNVKAITSQGKLTADKLLFDVETQTLNIDSFNDNKINANITK